MSMGICGLVDQTLLPSSSSRSIARRRSRVGGHQDLALRGAPAIGIAAAYGVCVGVQTVAGDDEAAFFADWHEVSDYLATSRPTAVNLFWALDRMRRAAGDASRPRPMAEIAAALLAEARAIHEEDRQMCRAIGRHGAGFSRRPGRADALQCGRVGHGRLRHGPGPVLRRRRGRQDLHIYADETRPLCRARGSPPGSCSTRHRGDPDLRHHGGPGDARRAVQAVVTGADRIAANGDTANKIGTYGVAVLAAAHDIPSTWPPPPAPSICRFADGAEIPIEQRAPREVTHGFGGQTAPEGVAVYNPAFDVTPAALIAALITERGVISRLPPHRSPRWCCSRHTPCAVGQLRHTECAYY